MQAFVPINHGLHWTFITLHVQDRRLVYYDSLNGPPTPHLEAIRR